MEEQKRLLSSSVWLIAILVVPIRMLIEQIALLVWPTAAIFKVLAAIHGRWVPFTMFVMVGYVAVYCVWSLLFRYSEDIANMFAENADAKKYRGAAVIVTIVWISLIALSGQLAYPYVLASVIVLIGVMELKVRRPLPMPEPDPSPQPEIEEEDQDPADSISCDYEWLFNEEPYRKSGRTQKYSVHLAIQKSFYEELLQRDHAVTSDSDYVQYANEQLEHEAIKRLVSTLQTIIRDNHYDELDEIHLAMSFTLSLHYAYDDVDYGREYPKYPVEMLVEKKGDCEDFAILCGAILYGLGHKVALLLMDFTDQTMGHAALGVSFPDTLPYPVQTVYSQKMNTDLVYCEATPSESQTTADSTDVQWWLGMMNFTTVHNFRDYPIG